MIWWFAAVSCAPQWRSFKSPSPSTPWPKRFAIAWIRNRRIRASGFQRSLLKIDARGNRNVFGSFCPEQILQLAELFGFSGGEVVGLAEVIVHLVEFPLVAIDVRQLSANPWGSGRRSAGDPAVIVN